MIYFMCGDLMPLSHRGDIIFPTVYYNNRCEILRGGGVNVCYNITLEMRHDDVLYSALRITQPTSNLFFSPVIGTRARGSLDSS